MESKINLELKHFCKDFTPLRKVVKGIGAEKIIVKKQIDYYFYVPRDKKSKISARFKLRIEDGKHILIWYRRPDFSAKKSTSSDVAVLHTTETHLLPFLKKALGVRAIVNKTRELWKKDNTVFHFDRVKGIGNVFEMEIWTTPRSMPRDRVKYTQYQKQFAPFLGKAATGSNENFVK